MIRKGAILIAALVLAALVLPQGVCAADEDIQKKLDALSKEVQDLKAQAAQGKDAKKSTSDWLTIGGDYRFRIDSLRGDVPNFYNFMSPAYQGWLAGGMVGPAPLTPEFKVKNDVLYTHRFGLNLKAKATKNVSVSARLLMYKTSGAQDDVAVSGLSAGGGVQPFFADRVGVFDGTQGHVPSSGNVSIDYAYVTVNNILDQPIWFSVGRRPSTGGIPSHLRQNNEKPGNAGIPAILVDYAFDGMTLGYAPDIEALPGAYAKICYGRGFENGLTTTSGNGLRDTDFVGVSVIPYDTDRLYLNAQWNRGMNIFDFPVIKSNTIFGNTAPTTDLGDIDWYGVTALSTLKNIGPGTLNVFASGAMSVTRPNDQLSNGMAGLLYTPSIEAKESKSGSAIYLGGRYDFNKNRTKLGFEYNHGTKNWVAFTPASDDIWTGKLGTRGNAYEAYLIQEFAYEPISSYVSKTFVRLGYQYYDFQYTGSSNWVGSPIKISELASNPGFAQMLIPLKNAQDIYATLEVKF